VEKTFNTSKDNSYSLDKSLIDFISDGGHSHWTIREAVEGVGIFGSIGSGKTSGSGKTLAIKYLKNGWGGLVLTTKTDEKKQWIEYCSIANRKKDLIIIEPGGYYHFNFLEYLSANKNDGASLTENIADVLKTVLRSSEEKSGGKSDDPFWESSLDMLIFNTIDLCQLAYEKVSVEHLYNIAVSAPRKDGVKSETNSRAFDKAFMLAQENVSNKIADFWKKKSIANPEKSFNPELLEAIIVDEIPEAKLLREVDQFFVEHYRNLSEKTRSIVDFVFIGFLFRLTKDPVFSLFCKGESNVTPEYSLNGKIILLNLPVKIYHKVGRDCQIMFKYIWQRAMEKRIVSVNPRPVFLFADEAQNFIHEYDTDYQATARSSRIATVYISQNLANYHANMGGLKSEYRVKSFLATLGTKIFHANSDVDTNNWASALIGDGYVEDFSRTNTLTGEFSSSTTSSYKLERMVRPEEFMGLASGGPKNHFLVESYVVRQNNAFYDGRNHKKITFLQ